MDAEPREPIIKPLLLTDGRSSRLGTRKELLQHALETLHSALPSAPTIYISLYDETQLLDIPCKLDQISPEIAEPKGDNDDRYHHHVSNPSLEPIFDTYEDIGPAAGLLAAHALFPEATWMVLGFNYPQLPPTALQQLVLEYQPPVTCFVNESGIGEPSIAIWGPEVMLKMKENVENGRTGLLDIIKQVSGKMINPLRQEWIMTTITKEKRKEVLQIVVS